MFILSIWYHNQNCLYGLKRKILSFDIKCLCFKLVSQNFVLVCLLSFGIKMLHWRIFNWYLNWLSPLFGFVFCVRQKGGEKFIDLVLHFTLYWWLFLCIKKGEKILFCFDFLPLCWWLTKRGRKILSLFEFYMHIYVLHILSLI